jgi:hypothetical protein
MNDEEKVVDGPKSKDVEKDVKEDGEKGCDKEKIVVKLSDLVGGFQVLQQLSQIDVKASTGRLLGKILKRVQDELQTREDQRKKLVEKYGEEDPDDPKNKVVLTPAQGGDAEKWAEFRTEIEEMDKQEVDLTGVPKLKQRDFRTSKGEADVKGAYFVVLDQFGILEE